LDSESAEWSQCASEAVWRVGKDHSSLSGSVAVPSTTISWGSRLLRHIHAQQGAWCPFCHFQGSILNGGLLYRWIMDVQIAAPAAEPMPVVSAKRQRFAEEYLIDLNAKQVAIRSGYSEKSAHSSGPRMLTFVEVKRYIALRQKQIAEAVQLTPEAIAGELAQIGFATIADYITIDKTGTHKIDLSKCTPDQLRAIGKLGGDGSIQLHKLRALDQLAKLLGFYRESVEVSGPDGGAIEIEANGLTAVELTQRLAGILADERAAKIDATDIGRHEGEPFATPDKP
jgi:phage terminase small subunit